MAEMSGEASELMRQLLNIRFKEVGISKEIASLLASDWLFPKYCEEPIGRSEGLPSPQALPNRNWKAQRRNRGAFETAISLALH